jgi:SMODS and SLOG-associating 2TM effector domain 2
MAIREATTSVEEPRPAGQRPDRRRRRRDLRVGPFPTAAMEQWQDTEAALAQLYRYAEGRAIDAIDWDLADKRGKRIWSRGLRLLVIVLVTAGGLQPLLDAAAPGPSRTAWGYAGDGRVGARVPEQPAAAGAGALQRRRHPSRVGTIAGRRRALRRPNAMPTDHGPELEALRKRLGDAKEFL